MWISEIGTSNKFRTCHPVSVRIGSWLPFMNTLKITKEHTANKIVNLIIEDIKSRKGIGDEYSKLRGDILHEMVTKWTKISTDCMFEYSENNSIC